MTKLTREEIYKLVWEKPMTNIAKIYLISDVGFRKLCKRFDIPVPKAGYWAKIQAGQKIPQPALPGGWQGKKHAELRERLPEQPVRQVSELDILVKQIAKERLPFKVPDRLSMPDPLIVAAKGSLGKLTDLRYPGMMVTVKGQLDIRVSKSNISRALRFMDTLIKLVRARGYRYEVNEEGNFVVIGKIKLRVNFRETTRRVRVQQHGYLDHEWQPTGKVVFRLDSRIKAEWMDLKTQLLEEQLPKVLAKLELTAKLEEGYLEKARLWHENWEKQRKLEEQRELRRKQEIDKLRSFIDKARQWKRAQMLREFLSAMPEENEEWLSWAQHKSDWFDPLILADDEWLGGMDKNEFWK